MKRQPELAPTPYLSSRRGLWLIAAWLLAGGCQLLAGVDADSFPPQDVAGAAGGFGAASGAGTAGDGPARQGGAGAGGAGGGAAGTSGAGGNGAGGAGGAASRLVTYVATGNGYSCAIVDDGNVLCWGYNASGQLGDGTIESRYAPTPVLQSPGGPPLSGAQQLALSASHSCARLVGGEVRCWGANDSGQLGDGTTENRLTPAVVVQSPGGPSLTGVLRVELGDQHSCALRNDGQVHCWGYNGSGQLGNNTNTTQSTPTPVLQAPGGGPVIDADGLVVGARHGCLRLTNGQARCWGHNKAGQLGDGTQDNRLTPVLVLQSLGGPPLTGIQELGLGDSHSCARLAGGDVRCWGSNGSGQVGDGTTEFRLTPATVLQSPGGAALTGVQELTLGEDHSCARLAGGNVRCWGSNLVGQLGDGTKVNQLTPVLVLEAQGGSPLAGVQGVAPGWYHSCARLAGDDVRCWGDNDFGELGDGTTAPQLTPVRVLFP
jgi:alpha-tubulin suppressor-like RCC1 family protein